MSRLLTVNSVTLGLLGPITTMNAYAETYMTSEQAVETMFPHSKMTKHTIDLTKGEIETVQKTADQNVLNQKLVVWTDSDKNSVFIDQVLGKHEFITFAVGISADGKIKAVEILEYRETYGQHVHDEVWTKQFVGKDQLSPLTLNKDIKNISGATLSSLHITNGVRRIIVTNELIKGRI